MVWKISPQAEGPVLVCAVVCAVSCALACVLATILAGHFTSASATTTTDPSVEWFRLQLHGKDAGFQEKRTTRNGYHSVSVLLIERDGEALALSQEETFTATALPRLDWQFVLAPGDTLRRSALFAPDSVRIFDGNGRALKVITRPESLLLPDEREAEFLRAAQATATRPAELGFHRLLPELETVVRIRAEQEVPRPNGTAAGAWNLSVVDAPHLDTREWRDESGRLLRWESQSSGWSAERTPTRPAVPETPAQLARRDREPTVGFRFLPRATYPKLVYRIQRSEGSPTLPPHPTIRAQSGSAGASGDVTDVSVHALALPRADTPRVGDTGSAEEGRPGHEALAATEWVDYDHPVFRPLLAGIDSDSDSDSDPDANAEPWIHAGRLVQLVHQKLRPSAGSHFAKASTALLQGHGDCTEFAVVLAALARASGLPTRFVAGWVGIDNSMGYHLWNEVYIDGAWFGLDAALNRFPTDARYVPMVVSSPDRDDPVQLFRELAAFGSIRIEVVTP